MPDIEDNQKSSSDGIFPVRIGKEGVDSFICIFADGQSLSWEEHYELEKRFPIHEDYLNYLKEYFKE